MDVEFRATAKGAGTNTMKQVKSFLLVFMTISILLGACGSAPESLPTSTPIFVENPIIVATPTPAFTCSVVSVEPTAVPGIESPYPPVSAEDFSVGPADASVTIIEYCDFQSQGCAGMANVIGELMRNHKDLRFVFRPIPLIGVTDKAEISLLAALAADEQGRFWEMYDLLFSRHGEWVNLRTGEFEAWLIREASTAGMDGDRLRVAVNAEETANRLTSIYEAAKGLGIPAVPLILINGEQFFLLDYQNISDTVGIIQLGQKQFTSCPPFDIDPAKRYTANIETEKGTIVIELLPDKAPLAVNSFIFLARQGWFDGVTFHRVLPGFVAQAGDPSGTGRGNPGYFFNNEISDLRFDKPGLVGMANSGPDTNGSQFFITYAPAPHLDGAYTIFGRVLSGLDVAENLTPRDPAQGGLLPPGDRIILIIIEEK
jgi:cyclophilin family peptidyl-prolyl cis-trans isomerase/protein-disulfide isomerase